MLFCVIGVCLFRRWDGAEQFLAPHIMLVSVLMCRSFVFFCCRWDGGKVFRPAHDHVCVAFDRPVLAGPVVLSKKQTSGEGRGRVALISLASSPYGWVHAMHVHLFDSTSTLADWCLLRRPPYPYKALPACCDELRQR